MKEVAQQEHVLSAHAGSEHGKQPAPAVMFNSILLFAVSSSVSCSKSFNIRSIVHLRTYLCCILKLYHAQITGASHICFNSDGFMTTGAAEGTCKERSDGIAIVAQSADRVSHRERVPSRQRETPHILRGVALVQPKGLEPIRFPIGT